jgi:hypothetical protein
LQTELTSSWTADIIKGQNGSGAQNGNFFNARMDVRHCSSNGRVKLQRTPLHCQQSSLKNLRTSWLIAVVLGLHDTKKGNSTLVIYFGFYEYGDEPAGAISALPAFVSE